MQPTACSVIAKRRFALQLSVFSLLMIALGLCAGCTQDGSNQNRTAQQAAGPAASPSPSPRASPPAFPPPPGETIIVIKDGSVDLEFDDTKFSPDNQTNPTKYTVSNATLTSVIVTPTADPSPSPTTCTITANSVVKLDAGGGNHDITITGNDTAKTVEIKFDKDEYKECKPGRKHCNNVNPFKHVFVDGRPCRMCRCEDRCEVRMKVSLQ